MRDELAVRLYSMNNDDLGIILVIRKGGIDHDHVRRILEKTMERKSKWHLIDNPLLDNVPDAEPKVREYTSEPEPEDYASALRGAGYTARIITSTGFNICHEENESADGYYQQEDET